MQPATLLRTMFRGAPFLAGLLVAALGATVLVGWQLGNTFLIQIRPWLPPMRPLVAAGLLFCGLGLIARQRAWRRIAHLSALAVIVLASSTLPQFVDRTPREISRPPIAEKLEREETRREEGEAPAAEDAETIDPELAEIVEIPDEPVEVAEEPVRPDAGPEGPIAPNTVIAFALAAGAIVIVRRSVYLGALLAVGVLTLGLVALLGYAADVTQAFGWGEAPRMAFHSALAFTIFGSGLILFAFEQEARVREERSWWRPILVGTSAAVAGVLFWSALRAQETDTIRRMVEATARGLRNEMITSTGSTILALTRLAETGQEGIGWDSPAEWQSDARLTVGAFRGFEFIEWIDGEFAPRIVASTREEPVRLADTYQNEIRRERALLVSRETVEPVVVGPFQVEAGGSAFRVIIPLASATHPEAYLSGLFSAQRAFSGLSRHLTPGYTVVVLCQGREVFRDGELDLTRPPPWTRRLPLELPGAVPWEIAIAPEPELLGALTTPLPGVAVGSALLIALLLTLTFRFADVVALRAATLQDAVKERTRELEQSMKNLQTEVHERRRTEDILRRTQTLGRLVSAELDLRKVVQAVADAATELTGAEAGCLVYTVHDEAGEAETRRVVSGPLGPAFGGLAADGDLNRFGSVLAVPVVSRSGQAQGTLRVAHARPSVFDGRDEEIAASLAAQAAIAMDNAMLYEAERSASRRLSATNEAKDNFIHLLGHELRNPLGSIRTAMKILTGPSRRDETPVPATRQDRARMRRIIDRQVDQLARLVDDLLEVSQLASEKLTLRPEPTDLTELVLDSVESVRARFEATGLGLAAEIPSEPVRVRADPHRVRQVLANLLTNARKFTDAGGRVTVRLHRDDHSREAMVSVQDTGCGIDPADLGRVFEPFVQTELARDRMTGGLGLGLPIVKGLVEAQGGRVDVHSEGRDLGCDFRFSLPLETAAPQAASRIEDRGAAAPRRILVVDDHRDSADALKRLLELGGNEVAVAYDGPGGLETARSFGPDVLVCDIGLPGMDGFEVARRLQAEPETEAIQLIALTGFGDEDTIRAAREAGFRRHLTKPVDTDRLAALLAECAERPRVS